MAFKALLGDTVVDNKGHKVDTATLGTNKAIGLYFSAHWCGPCRHFTPQLVAAYKDHLHAKGFQVVFVSSDRDEHSFKEYFGEMPWLALPFEARDLKQKLSAKYKVQGIPTLVILDSNGKVITKDGREAVSSDPKGANFPWTPKSFSEIIGSKFIDNKGGSFTQDALKDKVLGVYFSAHWCPPCRMFTPELIKTYNAVKAAGKPFEIVFVSSDQDEHAFKEYHGSMPWLAVPFDDRDRKNELSTFFQVEGIPTFVLIDAQGKVITTSGRAAISSDPSGKDFPWTPKPVNELDGNHASTLNETAGLIVFADDHDASKATEALFGAAKKYLTENKNEDGESDINFFVAKNHPLVARIKKLMSVSANSPVVAILDIPQEGSFFSTIKSLGDVTEASITQFIADYKAGKLNKASLVA